MGDNISEKDGLRVFDAENTHILPAGDNLVLRGLTATLREQLVSKSQEENIARWTPKDASERFPSIEAVGSRVTDTDMYALIERSKTGAVDLAGLIWFSERPKHGCSHTFAIRMYDGYVGKGLASEFADVAIKDFQSLHPKEQSIWLRVDIANRAARHLYEKLGFTSSLIDESGEIMNKILDAKNPKIVVIGGGTGSFTVLSGLKQYTPNITAVVNMSDDGGSSGELRDELGVLPPGDVRQCLVALSDNDVLRRIFEYRLKGYQGKLENHPLGNILLSGIEQMTGNFEEATDVLGQLLNIKGRVVPVTTIQAKLYARRSNGTVINGEETIGHMNFGTERPDIWLEPEAHITKSALTAIEDADIVVIAPGNLYGSLAPALVVNGVKDALLATRAKCVYVSNLVTKPDQTEGFMVHDFADEIERFIGAEVLDFVLYNTDEPPPSLLSKYTRDGEHVLEFDLQRLASKPYRAIGLPLIAKEPVTHSENDRLRSRRTLIRHDSQVLATEIIKLLSL
jgi:uncharacterized cofD-like protein